MKNTCNTLSNGLTGKECGKYLKLINYSDVKYMSCSKHGVVEVLKPEQPSKLNLPPLRVEVAVNSTLF